MRHYQMIAAAATLALAAVGSAFPQSGGTVVSGIGGGVGTASATFAGPGGMSSMRSDNTGTTFTYKFSPGSTVFAFTGAPYSGRTSSQTVRTLANGTHLNQPAVEQPMTYRDTMGRTRTDVTMTRPPAIAMNGANVEPRIQRLAEIIDPVTGYHYILDDVHKIAHRVPVQARTNQAPGPAVAAARVIQMPPRTMQNGTTMTNENLGTQTMFGINVTGQRNTMTYPVGTYQGNDAPVTTVTETWTATQWGLMIQSKNSGPESDSTTIMKDFTIDEPDPALFQVPAGYQIVDETGEFTISIPK